MSTTWKRSEAKSWETMRVKVSKMCLNTQLGETRKLLLSSQSSALYIFEKKKKKEGGKAGKDYLADTICQNFQQVLTEGFYEKASMGEQGRPSQKRTG